MQSYLQTSQDKKNNAKDFPRNNYLCKRIWPLTTDK